MITFVTTIVWPLIQRWGTWAGVRGLQVASGTLGLSTAWTGAVIAIAMIAVALFIWRDYSIASAGRKEGVEIARQVQQIELGDLHNRAKAEANRWSTAVQIANRERDEALARLRDAALVEIAAPQPEPPKACPKFDAVRLCALSPSLRAKLEAIK